MELYKPKAVNLLGRELRIRRSIIKDYCAAHSVLGMEDGKTALQTSNSKHNGEKWDRRWYLIKKVTSRKTDIETSDMHISRRVTSSSSYHLLCRNLPPSKATPSACLELLLSGSENYPKDIHCPHHASRLATSSLIHLEVILPPHISEHYSQARDQLFSHTV